MHVTDVNPKLAGDLSIFDYALGNNLRSSLLTRDFTNIQAIRGYPPKIVWLRMGNISTLNIINKLSQNKASIEEFVSGSELSILEIY